MPLYELWSMSHRHPAPRELGWAVTMTGAPGEKLAFGLRNNVAVQTSPVPKVKPSEATRVTGDIISHLYHFFSDFLFPTSMCVHF